jgi:hypothetical protein
LPAVLRALAAFPALAAFFLALRFLVATSHLWFVRKCCCPHLPDARHTRSSAVKPSRVPIAYPVIWRLPRF